MCDKAVNDSLAALKLIPNWFVTSKIIKELYTALHEDNGLLIMVYGDSGEVTFFCNEMDILNLNLNINLNNNFDEDNPDAFTVIRLLEWHSKF